MLHVILCCFIAVELVRPRSTAKVVPGQYSYIHRQASQRQDSNNLCTLLSQLIGIFNNDVIALAAEEEPS